MFFVTLIAAFTYILVPIFIPNDADLRVLVIESIDGKGKVQFNVEVAATPSQKAEGLMYRESLPAKQGMIFLQEQGAPTEISMWMKNTYIPLDMLFIDDGGTIVRIHEHAIPMDETSISSGEPVSAVLEINAGEAEKYEILIGDRVKNFKKFWNIKKALE